MLFNEPKLLKFQQTPVEGYIIPGFSALQRAEIAEIAVNSLLSTDAASVSVLFNEPKLLK